MGSQRAAKSQENLPTHCNRYSIRFPAISAPNLTDHVTLTALASVLEVHLLSGKEPRTTEADFPSDAAHDGKAGEGEGNREGRSGTHLANLLSFYLAIWLMRLPFLASILFS
jgi:hypothetical protein